MPGPGQVGRGWDLSRILDNYEQRINTLEKLARGAGTSAFLVDTPRWRSGLAGNLTTTTGTLHMLAFSSTGSAPAHDPGAPAFLSYSAASGEPRYTFLNDGLYMIQANWTWAGESSNGSRKGHLYNGATATPIETFEHEPPSGLMTTIATVHPFAAGAYFRVGCSQDSGVNVTIFAGGDATQNHNNRAAANLFVLPVGAYDVA
jgi:hypothetical protein